MSHKGAVVLDEWVVTSQRMISHPDWPDDMDYVLVWRRPCAGLGVVDLTSLQNVGALLGMLQEGGHRVSLKWDTDYGVNKREGWSVAVDGVCIVGADFREHASEAAALAWLATRGEHVQR